MQSSPSFMVHCFVGCGLPCKQQTKHLVPLHFPTGNTLVWYLVSNILFYGQKSDVEGAISIITTGMKLLTSNTSPNILVYTDIRTALETHTMQSGEIHIKILETLLYRAVETLFSKISSITVTITITATFAIIRTDLPLEEKVSNCHSSKEHVLDTHSRINAAT